MRQILKKGECLFKIKVRETQGKDIEIKLNKERKAKIKKNPLKEKITRSPLSNDIIRKASLPRPYKRREGI